VTGQWVIASRFVVDDAEADLLSQGSMGSIYRGTDTQTGDTVAIKALRPDLVADHPDIIARFIREGEALGRLKHPNIVKMVDAVEDGGCLYLVMEYISGKSLRDLLEEQDALPVGYALDIAIALADALTHAHSQGIIHRDLKPANVLLAETGPPRLTDFGVAQVAGQVGLTDTGVRIGTVNYFSPEACNGERLDPRADIWALGVILFEMLTGSHPFIGQTVNETAIAILTRPVPDLVQHHPALSSTLVELIYRMLEKDKSKRIPSMRLVKEGLQLEARLNNRRGDTV
jgi:serine/threonine-protein kinase